MQDKCACKGKDDAFCLCSTISEYSRQCSHAGGRPGEWRTQSFCRKQLHKFYKDPKVSCMQHLEIYIHYFFTKLLACIINFIPVVLKILWCPCFLLLLLLLLRNIFQQILFPLKNLRFDVAGDGNNLIYLKPKVNTKKRGNSSDLDKHALPCRVWLETSLT